jgi:hypothetical protein
MAHERPKSVIIITVIWQYSHLWVFAFSAKSLQVLQSLAVSFQLFFTFSFFLIFHKILLPPLSWSSYWFSSHRFPIEELPNLSCLVHSLDMRPKRVRDKLYTTGGLLLKYNVFFGLNARDLILSAQWYEITSVLQTVRWPLTEEQYTLPSVCYRVTFLEQLTQIRICVKWVLYIM